MKSLGKALFLKLTLGILVVGIAALTIASVWSYLTTQGQELTVPAPTGESAEKEASSTQTDIEKEQEPEPGIGPIAGYSIDATLLHGSRKITASEILTWKNTSSSNLDKLRFHLYYNAFKNLKSTFMKESEYYQELKPGASKLKYGEIKITEIRELTGADLTGKMRFIAPDDNNPDDKTVMEVKLPAPLTPGQTIRLKIQFVLTVPEIFARTGVEDDYYFIAQWFPKIGVLQADGQWNCHQFHENSEFFADYGEYQVKLTVPDSFIVGATGTLVKTEKNADDTRTYWYEEKDIHDFAWTAWPEFIKITDSIMLTGNNSKTEIELLLAPGHESGKDRYLNSLKFAMEYMSRRIMPYPYKKITLVDPPLKGINSGGMEYPTLITTGYLSFLPGSIKQLELVTIHEFVHQYWYGMVATDEPREAWLDEGITTFFENEISGQYFQDSFSLLDSFLFKIDNAEWGRNQAGLLLRVDPVNQYSWNFLNVFQYTSSVYYKPALLLTGLKNIVGKSRMYDFFKYYAEKFKFKHPDSDDFVDTFNTFIGEDFSWAFDQYIMQAGKLDQAVYSVKCTELSSKPARFRNEVVFVRNEGYFPVELTILMEDESQINYFWNEKEKWKRIVFDRSTRVKQASIDPAFKIPLDYNYLNNSMMSDLHTISINRPPLRLGFLFQNILAAFAF